MRNVVFKAFARTLSGQLCSLHTEEPPWRIVYQPGERTASGPYNTPLFAFQACEQQVAMTFLHKPPWDRFPGFFALELWQCEAEQAATGVQHLPYATDYSAITLYWRKMPRLLAGGKQIDLREWKKCLHNSRLSCLEHPLTSAPWGTLFCWGLIPVQQVFVRLPPQNRARKEA